MCAREAYAWFMARDTLADRLTFFLVDAAWAEFQAILDRPVQDKPALAKLFAEPSIFTDDESDCSADNADRQ